MFSLPGFWTKGSLAGNGTIWIRRQIELPESWAERDLIIHTGGIDKHDTTYFNGIQVGKTGIGFETMHHNAPRTYRVPGNLVKAGINLLAIRAYSFIYDGGFGGSEDMYSLELAGTGERLSLAGQCRFAVEVDFGKLGTPGQMGPDNSSSASILFDGMIRPLLPYTIRGFLWYQGENNTSSIREAAQYQRKLLDLIHEWRFYFGQGDLPFMVVQLPGHRQPQNFDRESIWARLRESQRRVTESTSNVGIITTIDCGDVEDLHPKDKKTVGGRLAAWALKHIYTRAEAVEFPVPIGCVKKNCNVIIQLAHTTGKLRFSKSRQSSFYVADVSEEFYPVEAELGDSEIILHLSENFNLKIIRYAWADNPSGSLVYSGNIPLIPFEMPVNQ